MPRRLQAETGFLIAGMIIAALSIGFAFYAITASSETPHIPGNEHLLIFTRPAQSSRAPASTTTIGLAPVRQVEADPVVTGSVGKRVPSPSARLENYVLLQIFGDRALLRGGGGLILAGPGTVLPGAGTVSGIEQRGGGWVVSTSAGLILSRQN